AKAIVAEVPDADEERAHAGAALYARGFGIEKNYAFAIRNGCLCAHEFDQAFQVGGGKTVQPDLAVEIVVGIDRLCYVMRPQWVGMNFARRKDIGDDSPARSQKL